MIVGPFPVIAVIERLRAQAPVLLDVGSAADLETALEQKPTLDAVAFVTAAELGRKPKYTGPLYIQDCDVTVRVVLMVRNYAGQAAGTGAREQMDLEVIPAVRAALLGWTPSDVYDGLNFQAGRDERFASGFLTTQQVFGTSYRMQQEVKP